MEESEQKEDFRVSDKRRFTSEGETKDQEPESDRVAREPESAERRESERKAEAETKTDSEKTQLPPINFSTFVLSLANTALFQLGLLRSPEDDGEVKRDLAGARQSIDILGMLEEKTRGNLTDEEKKILSEALFQLRMAFVEASK